MRMFCILTIACSLLMAASSDAEAVLRNSVVSSLGIPRGAMDYSINAAWRLTIDLPSTVKPEARLGGSFSTKSSSGSSAGMIVTSVYVLGRISFLDQDPKISPYIAAGPGLHFMYSFSSASGDAVELFDSGNSMTLLKAHAFFGIDFALTEKLFLTAEGRLTLPSDIVIDSGYLGLGLRL
ncbi:MAG: hypothetical protein ABIK83_07160 [Candidatus Zixiibacteriota bacterium]